MDRYNQFYEMANNIDAAMKNINIKLRELDVDYCFIGGVALSVLNYYRGTNDIDILVSKKDKQKILNMYGTLIVQKEVEGKLHYYWTNPEIEFNVIFSGTPAGGTGGVKYEEPSEISQLIEGCPYLSLLKMVEYKLSSGLHGERTKDFGDVQELIKLNRLPFGYANDFQDNEKRIYKALWRKNQREIAKPDFRVDTL